MGPAGNQTALLGSGPVCPPSARVHAGPQGSLGLHLETDAPNMCCVCSPGATQRHRNTAFFPVRTRHPSCDSKSILVTPVKGNSS